MFWRDASVNDPDNRPRSFTKGSGSNITGTGAESWVGGKRTGYNMVAGDQAEASMMGVSQPVEVRLDKLEGALSDIAEALSQLADSDGTTDRKRRRNSLDNEYNHNNTAGAADLYPPGHKDDATQEGTYRGANKTDTIEERSSYTAHTANLGNRWGFSANEDDALKFQRFQDKSVMQHGKHPNAPMSKDEARWAAINKKHRLRTNDMIHDIEARNARLWGRT